MYCSMRVKYSLLYYHVPLHSSSFAAVNSTIILPKLTMFHCQQQSNSSLHLCASSPWDSGNICKQLLVFIAFQLWNLQACLPGCSGWVIQPRHPQIPVEMTWSAACFRNHLQVEGLAVIRFHLIWARRAKWLLSNHGNCWVAEFWCLWVVDWPCSLLFSLTSFSELSSSSVLWLMLRLRLSRQPFLAVACFPSSFLSFDFLSLLLSSSAFFMLLII